MALLKMFGGEDDAGVSKSGEAGRRTTPGAQYPTTDDAVDAVTHHPTEEAL